MHIEGEDLDGVFGGNELLEYGKYPNFEGKKVAVIGGGNTAMDVARVINRKNARSVTVIYRRGREEMPAEEAEIDDAKDEGVEFLFQTNIVKILGAGKVEKVECIKTELIEVEGDRPRPVNIEGSNYLLDKDYVIMALGAKPDKNVIKNTSLDIDAKGYIKIDENNEASIRNIFVCGDLSRKQINRCMGFKIWKGCCRKGIPKAFINKNSLTLVIKY